MQSSLSKYGNPPTRSVLRGALKPAAPSSCTDAGSRAQRRLARTLVQPDSVIDAGMIQAYRETHYEVHGAEPFTLRVDEPSPELAAAHRKHRTDCSAYITACNPLSEDVGAEVNARRHTELGRELARRSLAYTEGIGQHPSNQWPGEPSYLVFGLTLEAARVLGRSLEQNAILWSDADAVPRLILLR